MIRKPFKPSTSKVLPRKELTRSTPLVAKAPMKRSRKGPARRTLAVRSEAWLDCVRQIPCCVRCGHFGVEAAHRDFGKGMGMKTDDAATAALCPGCHTDLGNGKLYSRDERRAGMDKAIVDTIIELARTGKIGVLESQEGCA